MRIIFSGILVFLIWTGLSSWFYVCQVKGLCSPVTEAGLIPIQEPEGSIENTAVDSSAGVIVEVPATLVIHFDTDQWSFPVDPDIETQSVAFKSWADNNPGSVIYVTGHTDATGSGSYNMALGEKRAEAVRDYLVKKGIPSKQIITSSMGEDRPVSNNSSRKGRAGNRRAEVSTKQ